MRGLTSHFLGKYRNLILQGGNMIIRLIRHFRIFIIIAISFTTTVVLADDVEKWQLTGVERFYLHNPPNSFTGLYRSQGIATNGQEWFFSWQYGLERADMAFNSLQRNSNLDPVNGLTPGIPLELLAQGLNHIGDIDYKDGIIYAPIDTTDGYNYGHVALYNANDLSYTGLTYALIGSPDNPDNDIASWVAIDRKGNYGYGKEWQEGNTINVYKLDDWSYSHAIVMDAYLKNIQGGKIWKNWLYLSSDNETRSVYRVNIHSGHVQELFQLPAPPGDLEVEGLALIQPKGGPLNLYVEMVVDPNYSNHSLTDTELNLSLFHYIRKTDDDDQKFVCLPKDNGNTILLNNGHEQICDYNRLVRSPLK